jgi:enoyl-CoA hydratase/carnithine racemase
VTTILTSISGGVGWITLNRPERMNAITVELARELERAILEISNSGSVNAILIRGSGGNFCAGGDFTEVERLRSLGPAELRTLFDAFRRVCDAIAAVDLPVVAAVEGIAMAGGFELMQAVDIVLVSDDARIADNHVKFGMIPGGGSSQRLPRLVGRQIALGLLLSGDRLSGLDAVRYGLAYRSFPQDNFDDGVKEFIAGLAGRERSAVTAIKRLASASQDLPMPVGLDDEIAAVVEHISRQDVAVFGQIGARQ